MSHMERVGVRELRRDASGLLRRVAAGERIEITDRGRVVAVLVQAMPRGLAQLEAEGLIRPATGDLLALKPVPLAPCMRPPSELVSEGRDE